MTEVNIQISDLQPAGNLPTKLVKISGQLDESNVDEKIKQVYALLQAGAMNLIFDLEELQYMNSKSIGYLTDLYGKVTEKGGKIVVSKARPNIDDILQVVGLNQLIPLVGSNEEAMLKLGGATQVAPPAAPTPAPQAMPQAAPAPAPAPQAIDLGQVPPAAPPQA